MERDPGRAVADVLAYRQSFYDLLRRIFLWEVPPELFSELVLAAKGERDREDLACSHESSLKNFLKEVSADDMSAVYRDINIEYTRLFLGPRHLPAPPYESVYRSPQRLMMQDSTMEVRSIYSKNGFRVVRLNQEPDDSIGIELEFMCALSSESIKAFLAHDQEKLARLISTQLEFCDLHLLRWVPQFCGDIISNTCSEFWKSIGDCTKSFLEQDFTELGKLRELLDTSAASNHAGQNTAAS